MRLDMSRISSISNLDFLLNKKQKDKNQYLEKSLILIYFNIFFKCFICLENTPPLTWNASFNSSNMIRASITVYRLTGKPVKELKFPSNLSVNYRAFFYGKS